MKRLVLLTIFSALLLSANASHIKGGFFTYRYLGAGINNPSYYRYRIELTMYMRCDASGSSLINNPINFTFFDAGTNQFIQTASASISNQYQLGKSQDDQCITGDQSGCYYLVVVYSLPSIELAPRANGYTVAYQRCCRIAGMQNILNSSTVGATYAISIPGTATPFNAVTNSSPIFPVNDTVVVCIGKNFSYSFQAHDIDGDSLAYNFCDAYQGGGQDASGAGCTSAAPDPACPPPYASVPYAFPYSGSKPLGALVTINPATGVISGIAPDDGEYVVTVCVSEFRNGVLIATSRKELHVLVRSCDIVQASLNPSYITCDGFTLTFSNNTPSPLIQNYYWDFGVASMISDTSVSPTPTFTYPDTGIYVVKLIVNKGLACTDSTTTIAKVYPGFFPAFDFNGICANHPTQFLDQTTTAYGVVDSWSWNFGAPPLNDTSHIRNPVYTYTAPGNYNVQLIVTNSKGCVDTVSKAIDILDKPPLTINPKDTLICVSDAVQLQAIGSGIFTWTPATNISNTNIANPIVSPTTTTWYYVQLNQNGCLNNDSARVRVVDHVNLTVRSDTTICKGDAVQLSAQTNGLQYSWTPASLLSAPNILNPIATVNANTTFSITSTIGSCNAVASMNVFAVPYPFVSVGNDTTICYNSAVQLHGTFQGNSFSWSPTSSLSNPNSPNPVATPINTTTYVLTVFDNAGCPKPGRDSVTVIVSPKVKAFAGHDTAVVVGQPLHFNASGGVSYLWSPTTALSNPAIHNPVAVYDGSFDLIRYRVIVTDAIGCFDSAFINVKIFNTNPQIFVPTAFTPNGDGKNDKIRPIGVGIKKIEYFRIYNRWGQLVFSTSINGDGWDGKIGGQEQSTNTFVWIVSGIDYLDRHFFKKGTVTLIK